MVPENFFLRNRRGSRLYNTALPDSKELVNNAESPNCPHSRGRCFPEKDAIREFALQDGNRWFVKGKFARRDAIEQVKKELPNAFSQRERNPDKTPIIPYGRARV